MIWFFIKKNFFDGWDNLLTIVLYNGVFLALAIIGFFTTGAAFNVSLILGFVVLVLFLCLFMIFVFAVNQTTAKYADYKAPAIKETFLEIPSVWKDALLLSIYVVFWIIIGVFITLH